ncbi:hypothetical protein AB836_02110 [Rickettsiales bacterium (ex Bugula neritina AB1)]|nr:hypothetical protein AB836_02110 [Rickettsiales bacterium (ex Bugula neritina AB1)]
MGENLNENYLKIRLDDEMKESYIVYAVSILERAIPSVFDGLKNVQRRIIWTMCEINTQKLRKSATVVGDVMGKYHPHGDSAIYQTIVRLSQDFVLLHPLIYGHGNFGSIDGDGAAAHRYTEIKLEAIAYHLFEHIYENTVDFRPNYDGTRKEPVLLPVKFPHLLVNGAQGIAVGYATSIPPHNLKEVLEATRHLIHNPNCSIDDLLEFVKGPDFPTGGIISSKEEIRQAYKSGNGIIKIRGKTHIEKESKIIITEIPHQLTKSALLEKIIQETKNGKIENVQSVRDESDNHIRIIIELKKHSNIDVTLNQLYTFTPLLSSYRIYLLALNEEGKPQLFNLKSILQSFIDFRHEIISRKAVFNLKEYEKRINVLFGYVIGLDNIDELVDIVKHSPNTEYLKDVLGKKSWKSTTLYEYMKDISKSQVISEEFVLNKIQIKSILEMRLQNLTKMEKNKIINEINEIKKIIIEKREILTNVNLRNNIIEKELLEIESKFSKPRYTKIEDQYNSLKDEDFIPKEDMVITLSQEGFLKRTTVDVYKEQHRGGKGSLGFSNQTNQEDFVQDILIANTHDTLLLFTSSGIVFSLKTYKIPLSSKSSKGRFTTNFIPLKENDKIIKILPITNKNMKSIFFVTNLGHVRKNSIDDFKNLRADGKIYMKFMNNEQLINVCFCDENTEIMLFTKFGKAIRFNATDVREFSSRNSVGVRGCILYENDEVISLITDDMNSKSNSLIFTTTAEGFGKCTKIDNYRKTKRGAKGVINIKLSKTDYVVSVENIKKDTKNHKYDDIIIITSRGQTLRFSIEEVRNSSRSTKGVKVINMDKNNKVVSVTKLKEEQHETIK